MVAPPPTDGLIGRRLGEFEILERVAVGGFGELYRARQATLGRDAVIKVLANASAEAARDRFTREAQLASQLDHPYAAHIYAFGVEADGLQWIAMELVRGVSLAELLKAQGSLPVARFVPLFQAICQVVQVAHEQGIVHRDLKPANVMVVARAGVLLPKLLDFGIARLYTAERAQSKEADERVQRMLDATEARAEDSELARFDRQLHELLGERIAEISSTPQSDANLTSGAVYLGSPPYMAPELWLRPHAAGPACDVYALGVLAFECLVGRRPYEGSTTADIARAHLQPLPELGASAPPALHAVLLKATAKRAKDRYPDALALSAAVEAACRGEVHETLPRAPAELVSAVLARAPQPIAEIVASADAATRADEARERYAAVLELVAHYLGIVGLASWCRLGCPDSDGAVRAAVRRLCQDGFGAADWVALAGLVTRPFVRLREAFPVPELVDACGPPAARLEAELAAANTAELEALVAGVGAVLGELGELFEYQVGVRGDRGLERWSGTRRRPRPVLAATSDAPDGAPVLIDRNGAAVLSLWPLAKPIAPTQAGELELFLVAGLGRYGARLVAQPHGFTRQDPELAAWLEELAGGLGDASAAGEDERVPYRGLASFSVADSELFFGRERESEVLANHLRTHSFAAVVGPSGAGKSSFVQAGVVPLLPAGWRAVVMRPGSAPFAVLHEKLGRPVTTMAELDAAARERDETLVLVIDQSEELVTLCRDEAERAAFATFLASVRDDSRVRVVLTLRDDFLMRVQRLPGLGERLPSGMTLLGTPSRADLRRILIEPARRMGYELEDAALVEEMVGAVVDNPSALALLSFTAARLWELRDRQFRKLRRRVYASLGGVGGALAQHAEEVIAAMADDERDLVREAFRHLVTADGTRAVIAKSELGELLGGGDKAARVIEGLVNARLAVTAESSAGITVEITHEALLESWPRLVTWRREDAENARLRDRLRASARQWHAEGRQRGMLWRGDVLVEYRLWRARYRGRLAESEEQFAAACLREEARGRRLRRALTTSAFAILAATALGLYVFADRARASAHQASARTIELLEEQGRRELLDHHPVRAATPLARAYALGGDHASLRFLLAAALHAVESQRAILEGHTGFVRRAVFSADGARVVTASDDGTVRLWDAATGRELGRVTATGPVRLAQTSDRALVAAAAPGTVTLHRTADLGPVARRALPAGTTPATVALDEAGARVVVGDRAGGVHVLAAGGLTSYRPHTGAVLASVITPDGTLWATGGEGGRVALGRDGAPRELVHGDATVTALALDLSNHPSSQAAGPRFASGGADGSIVVWRGDGERLRALPGHAKGIRALAFSPDGALLASASEDGTLRLWRLDTTAPPVVLGGHEGIVMSTAFDRDGGLLLSTGADGTVRLWNVASAAPLAALDVHVAEVWSAAFDATGTRIVSAGFDRTARVWEPWRGDRRLELAAPEGGFAAAAFDATGAQVALAGADGTALVIDATGRTLASVHTGGTPLRTIALAPDRGRLVTGAEGEAARLWTLVAGPDAPPRASSLAGTEAGSYAARFAPDGRELAVAGEDGTVRVFDASGTPLRQLAGHGAAVWGLAYSADGTRLASTSDDRTARIWDRATGTLVLSLGPSTSELNAAAFDPAGERLAVVGSDGMLRVFRVADGLRLGEVAAHHDNATAVAFSADGERLATASFDHTVHVWDARTLRELAQLRRHTGEIHALGFQPGTDRLLTTGSDGAVWLTELPLERRAPDVVTKLVR